MICDDNEHAVDILVSRIASRQRSVRGKASFAGREVINVLEATVQARRRLSAGTGVFGAGGEANRVRRKGISCEEITIFAESFTGPGISSLSIEGRNFPDKASRFGT
jgi:hypothetical protein